MNPGIISDGTTYIIGWAIFSAHQNSTKTHKYKKLILDEKI